MLQKPLLCAIDPFFVLFDLFTAVAAPTTCSLLLVLTTCEGVPKARRIDGRGGPESAWKTDLIHTSLWKEAICGITTIPRRLACVKPTRRSKAADGRMRGRERGV